MKDLCRSSAFPYEKRMPVIQRPWFASVASLAMTLGIFAGQGRMSEIKGRSLELRGAPFSLES